MATKKKRVVSDEHKAAMAQGRNESRAIAAYLDALESNKPKRGRKRTPESISKRLEKIEQEIASASGIKKLSLIQERMDLQSEKESLGASVDLSGFEAAFVKSAKGYSERKGISYTAWRELGVAADVLKKAGIGRGA
jgi:hypothetical protein